jgi:hypothetical protein
MRTGRETHFRPMAHGRRGDDGVLLQTPPFR